MSKEDMEKLNSKYCCNICGCCGETDCCDIIKCLRLHLSGCLHRKIYVDYVSELIGKVNRLERELESANSELASLM